MTIVTLETERLRLRAFEPADLGSYAARIFGDPAVMKYLPARGDALPIERAQRTMDFFNAEWTKTSYGPWAVERAAEGELIGHCGLRYIGEVGETEVLYAFGRAYWGQGYATEAARASVAFGFDEMKLDRIIALAVPENVGSRKVMEKCGLKYEKETELFGLHCVYYALNRNDYKENGNPVNPSEQVLLSR